MPDQTPAIVSTLDEFRLVLSLASSVDVNVLIAGGHALEEECTARLVHHQGRRTCGQFVKVSCAALSDDQFEWLLFHTSEETVGTSNAVARAAGGTLFLESIDELTLQSQARLMRFLDQGARPDDPASGGRALDTRIICSTGLLLYAAVLGGTFREDLYYRLNTMSVEVPCLTAAEWVSCGLAPVN
jgi:DNA-binding NtrC family response regulator